FLCACGGGAAAGAPACRRAVDLDFVAVAPDAAPAHFKTDPLAGNSLLFLLDERVAADETASVEFHDPGEIGFPGRDRRIYLMSVERHLRFEPERISRPQTRGLDAEFFAGRKDLTPDARRFRRSDVDFKAILAGVAGACDPRGRAADGSVSEPVILDRRDIDRCELSQGFERPRALNR